MGLKLFHITEFAQSMVSPASQREAYHPAWVVLLGSLWLALAGNLPLWRELARLPLSAAQAGWIGLCFALLTTGVLMALLSAVNWRWLLKLALIVLCWLAALNSLLLWAQFGPLQPAWLQAPSQGLEPLRHLPVGVLLGGLGLLGVLPTLLLWRTRLQRVAAPRMLPQNLLLFVLGTALVALAWFAGHQTLLPLLQEQPRWLDLLTPLNTLLSLRP